MSTSKCKTCGVPVDSHFLIDGMHASCLVVFLRNTKKDLCKRVNELSSELTTQTLRNQDLQKESEILIEAMHEQCDVTKGLYVEIEELQATNQEYVKILGDIVKEITQPNNSDTTIGEFQEYLSREYPDYFSQSVQDVDVVKEEGRSLEERPERFYIASWHFNWNPFKPKQCIGGPVYFGHWAVCKPVTGGWKDKAWIELWTTEQSASQVQIKQNMGCIDRTFSRDQRLMEELS